MRIVIDAIPVRFGGFAVALEAMLAAWSGVGPDDELHLVAAEDAELEVPASVHERRVGIGRPAVLKQVLAQSRVLPRVCREVGADVLLAILPTTALTDVGCPKVITVYDLRHEILPEQFPLSRRLMRKLSYGAGYRQAAGIICISERTRSDLLRSRPWLGKKPVSVALWGADHVDGWTRMDPPPPEPYALAFGHFVNKGVDRVIEAWEILKQRGEARPLVFVGLPSSKREEVTERIAAAGLVDVITPLPWLDRNQFQERFASAGLILFPSDFEGFGLPAVEALQLEIPLVISTDKALLEVTGGNAEVVKDSDPGSLADSVERAWARSDEDSRRGREWVESFTWARMAAATRAALAEVVARRT